MAAMNEYDVLGYRFTDRTESGCEVETVHITHPLNNYPDDYIQEHVSNIRPLVSRSAVGEEITYWKMKLIQMTSNFEDEYYGNSEMDADELVDWLLGEIEQMTMDMRDRTKKLKNDDSGLNSPTEDDS